MRLLIHSAAQIVKITDQRDTFLTGDQMKSICVFQEEGGVAVVVDSNGRVADIGVNTEIKQKWKETIFEEVIDATGMCILPGFVDAHTHPIWGGDRVEELIMKLQGATYMEIHQKGGGIYSTVNSTMTSSDDELYESLKCRLMRMLHAGTTLVECKSGYGLETQNELKLLEILQKAKNELPMDIVITYCGAHAIPRGKTSEEAVKMIIDEQLPVIKKLNNSKVFDVENIDVFCEKGVYDLQESKKILQAGKNIGLKLNFHADELHPLRGAEMGAELGASAVSHLEEISDEGITALARSRTAAIILPTTAFFLHLKSPPVRKLINQGVPVALGTDFNPNAYCLAMPLVMQLACFQLGMSVTEALSAATLNAAASLGRSSTHGSIEIGKFGDFVVINAPRWEHIIYQYGAHDHVIYAVIKNGRIVHRNVKQEICYL